jgi:AcrR family transcriptional regulator/DNA-binding MarR family transcriptional regulator
MASGDHTPAGLERPRSEHDLASRSEVDDIQRARIVSAMIEVSSEHGYIGAAIAPVVARAGVSRRTFYELFEGREDCFLAAFEWGVAQARSAILEARAGQRTWRTRMRASLAGLLTLLDAEPELARVCFVEALGAGPLVLARRAQIADETIAALGAGAPRPRGAAQMPLLTAEGVVGGAFSVIHARLLEAGRPATTGRNASTGATADAASRPLIDLHGQLMALIALPYLGPSAAGEELTRTAPELPPRKSLAMRSESGGGRLLERLDMRLTYRTVRCLMFIAEHPASSNREVARGAEIPDEGQASKLLGRLVKLGLILNAQAPGPGLPNRWTLTPHGEQVLSAVRGR